MLKTLACALAIGVLCVSAASAGTIADPSSEPVQTETVRFGDLNLATSAGMKAFHQRLKDAAYRVCDEKLGTKTDVFAKRRARGCQILAVARAQAAVSAARSESFLSAAR